MTDNKLLTTELMLKDLIWETDQAVAKAQAAMAKITGKPQGAATAAQPAEPISMVADQAERLAVASPS